MEDIANKIAPLPSSKKFQGKLNTYLKTLMILSMKNSKLMENLEI